MIIENLCFAMAFSWGPHMVPHATCPEKLLVMWELIKISMVAFQGEHISGAEWRPASYEWVTHCEWHLLQLLPADTGLEICKFDHILYSLCQLQVHVLLQSAYVDLDLHILLIPSVAWLCVTRKQICHVGNAIRSWNPAALGQLSFHTETVYFYSLVNFSTNWVLINHRMILNNIYLSIGSCWWMNPPPVTGCRTKRIAPFLILLVNSWVECCCDLYGYKDKNWLQH